MLALPDKVEVIKNDAIDVGIQIKEGAFGWKTGESPIISNINFEIGKGELVIVIGVVGSGKSTLLYSLMHESILMKGTHNQNGTLAYVEQEPFIFSASIKENIILGMDFNEKRFKYAIKVS